MFAVIGEALLDMVQPEPGHTFVAQVGGGPLNIAIGLRRLGHPTEMMARFSSGSLGELVRRHAEANDLGLSASVTSEQPTTLAFATLDEQGRASYDFYVDGTADWGWSADELAGLPTGTRVLHTGSVAAAISPGADLVLDLFTRLRSAGETVLSFDPNVRPALVGPRDEAVARVERFVAASHVVKASDEDLAWLYPGDDLDDRLRVWSHLGPEVVVMTRGADGCTAMTRSGHDCSIGGRQVDVADTIGAGDSFESGLLSGLADAGVLSPRALAAITRGQLDDALERAVTVSSMTCERPGADPPSRAEYDARSAAS